MSVSRVLSISLWAAALAFTAPPAAAIDKVDDLEARTQKEVEDATEILGKVQAGKMDYVEAMKKLKEYRAHAEELEAESESRAAKYIEELNQIIFWTKKFMPMDFGFTKPTAPPEPPKTDPATPAGPAAGAPAVPEAPTPTPRADSPAPAPAPAPEPERRAAPKQVKEITWTEIVLPEIPQNLSVPELPEQPYPRAGVILPLLDDADVGKRIWAGCVAATCPTPPLVKKCFDVLQKGADPREQMAAAFALSNQRHDDVFRGFDDAVETWDGEALERLWLVMSNLPEKRTVEAMFKLVMRMERPVGGADSMSEEDMRRYKEKAADEYQRGWRARAVGVWKQWPEPVISAGLSLFFSTARKKNKTPWMQEVLLACGCLRNSRLIAHAVPFLQQGREETLPLRAPAKAAVEMVGKDAVPWLIGGLTNGATKNWCVRALREISNETLAMQPKLWWAWYNNNR
jgi:hypothetical protein